MDLIEKLRAQPADWRVGFTGLASFLGVSRASVYRYMARDLIAPDLTRGNRRYFSKACVHRFVKGWFTNPDRLGA